MRYWVNATLAAGAVALAVPAVAQQEAAPVPVEKASYHWPVFRNDLVMVLRVIFPPGRGSNYHIHSTDQISILVEAGSNSGQDYGKQPTPPRPGTKGNVGFTAYSKETYIHKSTNMGTTPFHNVVVALLYPQPGRFTAGSRSDVAGYAQVLDNERVRGWRLKLAPASRPAPSPRKLPACET